MELRQSETSLINNRQWCKYCGSCKFIELDTNFLFGHNLHLAITKALNNDVRCSRALGVARKIVSGFSLSWKRKRELTKAQLNLRLPQHSLITDCATRWGSMHKIIGRLLEQEKAIRIVFGVRPKCITPVTNLAGHGCMECNQ